MTDDSPGFVRGREFYELSCLVYILKWSHISTASSSLACTDDEDALFTCQSYQDSYGLCSAASGTLLTIAKNRCPKFCGLCGSKYVWIVSNKRQKKSRWVKNGRTTNTGNILGTRNKTKTNKLDNTTQKNYIIKIGQYQNPCGLTVKRLLSLLGQELLTSRFLMGCVLLNLLFFSV